MEDSMKCIYMHLLFEKSFNFVEDFHIFNDLINRSLSKLDKSRLVRRILIVKCTSEKHLSDVLELVGMEPMMRATLDSMG